MVEARRMKTTTHYGSFAGERIDLSQLERTVLRFEHWGRAIEVEVLKPQPGSAQALTGQLKDSADRYLRRLPVNYIVDVIAEAARRWLDPIDQFRREAEDLLPVITGFSGSTITLLLDQMFHGYTAERLSALLNQELRDPLALDEFRPKRNFEGQMRAYGPRVTTHIFGGNNPALPALSLISSLLCKSASVGKLSSQEPVFASLFIRSVASVDPKLGESFLILWWPGGSSSIERDFLDASDAAVVFGNDETVRSLTELMPPGKRLLAYGHRIAVAIVVRDALAAPKVEEAARSLAIDVCTADQLSCLAPQVVYVEEGGEYNPRDFAALLARELGVFESQVPRCETSIETTAYIKQFKHSYQFREYSNPDKTKLFAPDDLRWMVAFDSENGLVPGPGYRIVKVHPVNNWTEVLAPIRNVQPLVSTVGVSAEAPALTELAEALGAIGVSRICRVGRMQNPSLGWRNDGWLNLSALLRWTDLETG